MELWDLYDENENLLHKTHIRGLPIKQGEYHLVVQIWSFSNGKLLVTKRHPDKPHPLMWEITGGSVLTKETALLGAQRELFEETGIKAELHELKLVTTKIENNTIYKSFVLIKNFNIEEVVLQDYETIDAKLVDKDEWLEMIKQEEVAIPIKNHFQKYKNTLECYFK